MTGEGAALAENIAQRCFHWRVGDVCYLGGGSPPIPKCTLCPNWIDRKDWSKTWFTLQRPESAVEGTGLQGVFTIEPDEGAEVPEQEDEAGSDPDVVGEVTGGSFAEETKSIPEPAPRASDYPYEPLKDDGPPPVCRSCGDRQGKCGCAWKRHGAGKPRSLFDFG